MRQVQTGHTKYLPSCRFLHEKHPEMWQNRSKHEAEIGLNSSYSHSNEKIDAESSREAGKVLLLISQRPGRQDQTCTGPLFSVFSEFSGFSPVLTFWPILRSLPLSRRPM